NTEAMIQADEKSPPASLRFDRLAPTYWLSTPPLVDSSRASHLGLFDRPENRFDQKKERISSHVDQGGKRIFNPSRAGNAGRRNAAPLLASDRVYQRAEGKAAAQTNLG